jgi:ribonuclease VapC
MTEVVLDASALLAFLRREKGAERVAAVLPGCYMSSVNVAETISKMIEYGDTLEEASYQIDRLRISVVPFDEAQAKIVASLWKQTRQGGLGIGDRACLALALAKSLPAYTTESEWQKCHTGVKIIKIR